jgi:hypothetical protein
VLPLIIPKRYPIIINHFRQHGVSIILKTPSPARRREAAGFADQLRDTALIILKKSPSLLVQGFYKLHMRKEL